MVHGVKCRAALVAAAIFSLLSSASHALPGGLAAPPHLPSQAPSPDSEFLPLEDFSPSFLGMYRKVMEIEDEILQHAERYDLDPHLAWAVCLYESGGNANLTSKPGARGYFQVMPRTFRSLRVETNIEAGVKYLAQMVARFDREDYALAAYNGGPSRVSRRRRMPLATLQYVLNVGDYRTNLKMYEPSIRHHAQRILLEVVGEDDDWWAIAKRLDRSVVELRLHNPFLANLSQRLRPGQVIAYPDEPREAVLFEDEGGTRYLTRHGDNYLHLAFALDVDLDELREQNALWRLQVVPAGMLLRIPLDWEGSHTVHQVGPGETLEQIAEDLKATPWGIVHDNALWDEEVSEGMVLRVRPVPPLPTYFTHRVTNGDTLGAIAVRYGSTVAAIQAANGLGRRTVIRIGQALKIPR